MIQKEGMDIVHNLLIQSSKCLWDVHGSWSILLLDQREGGGCVDIRRSVSTFYISCLNYVIQTHIKDNLQALVLLLSFL